MKRKLNCVLLIDDDEPTNYLNEIVVAESNIAEKIISVQSARLALEMLQGKEGVPRCNPDLIFLDINMPVVNGWEFIAKYKDINSGSQGKVVVMLTTSVNRDDERKAMSIAEISDYVNKPLSTDVMHNLMHKHFPGFR